MSSFPLGTHTTQKSELLFLGTGTSGGLPDLACLLDAERKCKTCWNAIEPGSRNRRQNTSIVIRTTFTEISDAESVRPTHTRNILIDCGKYFWASALKSFPEADIDHLDAVILTHAHADAFFGVDDLRDFANIRDGGKPLPVYVREQDMADLSRTFPYLMNKGRTANGMHVPALNFLNYDETAPFDVCGVVFKPLQVHHGPGVTCTALSFGNVVYMSDVNEIPDAVRSWITDSFEPYNTPNGDIVSPTSDTKPTLDLMILDTLWPEVSYNSHFSLKDAVEEFKRFRPKKGYAIGMSHQMEHHTFSSHLKEVSADNHLDLELSWDGLRIEITLSSSPFPLIDPAIVSLSPQVPAK